MRYFIQTLLFIYLYITRYCQPIKSQECLSVSASTCNGNNLPRFSSNHPSSSQGLPGKRGPVGKPGPPGQKGEQGRESNKIYELEKEMSELRDAAARNMTELQSQISSLQAYIESIRTGRYTISMTPRKGTYDQAREMCREKGGDLLQKCLSRRVNGYTYEHEIAAFLGLNLHALWIGINDREDEGRWRYLDGRDFNGHESDGEDLLYYWDNGQPETSDDCGGIHHTHLHLHDWGCTNYVFYGLCEIPDPQ